LYHIINLMFGHARPAKPRAQIRLVGNNIAPHPCDDIAADLTRQGHSPIGFC
jgi:hypothetical protein